jgi:hypothetical protein
MNQTCIMCRQLSSNTKLQKLQLIKQRLNQFKVEPSKTTEHFMWGSNIRCKYGITCPKLQKMNRDISTLCKQIEPYLISVTKSNDSKTYYEILQLMRGDFPSAYSKMERMYRINRKNTINN